MLVCCAVCCAQEQRSKWLLYKRKLAQAAPVMTMVHASDTLELQQQVD